MGALFDEIRKLIAHRKVRLSLHAHTRLVKRGILFADVISGVGAGEVLEAYPEYHAGPAVLVLQSDRAGRPIHAIWGIESGTAEPAVLVTAYYPDPSEWSADFRVRK